MPNVLIKKKCISLGFRKKNKFVFVEFATKGSKSYPDPDNYLSLYVWSVQLLRLEGWGELSQNADMADVGGGGDV